MTTNQLQSPVAKAKLVPAEIKERHTSLYQEVQDARDELPGDPSKRDQLIQKIDKLIANMESISVQMKKSGNYAEYDWLERTATKWQGVFSEIFAVARNIRDEIKLPPRPAGVISSRERAEIPYSQIRSEIAVLAYSIGQDRKLSSLRRKIKELERERNRIHSEFPSSPEMERQDWHDATVYFAANVLSGRLDLAYQLGADSYRRLEQVFLDEVKQLNAYYIWQGRGNGWGLSEKEEDYLNVCEHLRKMLLDEDIKAPPADFSDVRSYLIKNYLNNKDKSFPAGCLGSEAAEELKRSKAQRIGESKSRDSVQSSWEENWKEAEKHAVLFYDNVIDAFEGQPEKIEKVLQAFHEPWRRYGVINCLEAAIAIYFFDTDLIRKYCKSENDII